MVRAGAHGHQQLHHTAPVFVAASQQAAVSDVRGRECSGVTPTLGIDLRTVTIHAFFFAKNECIVSSEMVLLLAYPRA